MTELDVVAVRLDDMVVLWTMKASSKDDAEGAIKMAVFRQGVEDRYFTTARRGKFKTGDTFTPGDAE